MIQLQRLDRSRVPAGLRGRGRIIKNLELLADLPTRRFRFKSRYWKAGKNLLKAESHGKCAYCEAPTTLVAHGDVEHFRPKAKYWWLAYCYDNHLFACQICNQTYKSDHFPTYGAKMRAPRAPSRDMTALAARCGPDPLDDSSGMSRKEFFAASKREETGLIDPYLIDPEPYFAWEADDDLKEVHLIARRAANSRRAVGCAERYLGLNREELLRWRYRTYEKLSVFAGVLEEERLRTKTRQAVTNEIKRMTLPEAEFAGMVRYFVSKWALSL